MSRASVLQPAEKVAVKAPTIIPDDVAFKMDDALECTVSRIRAIILALEEQYGERIGDPFTKDEQPNEWTYLFYILLDALRGQGDAIMQQVDTLVSYRSRAVA